MKLRWHHGGLDESMRTVIEIEPSLDALTARINEQWCCPVTADQIEVSYYGFDNRINWETHLVTIDGAAVGYTDGPIAHKGE